MDVGLERRYAEVTKSDLSAEAVALLREARDLLDHDRDHEDNIFCPGCDLEERIDAALISHRDALCGECHHQRRSHWPACNYAECDCEQFDGVG